RTGRGAAEPGPTPRLVSHRTVEQSPSRFAFGPQAEQAARVVKLQIVAAGVARQPRQQLGSTIPLVRSPGHGLGPVSRSQRPAEIAVPVGAHLLPPFGLPIDPHAFFVLSSAAVAHREPGPDVPAPRPPEGHFERLTP